MAKNVETGTGKDMDPFALNVAAKQAVAQGFEVMDKFFDGLKQTIASAPSGGTSLAKSSRRWQRTTSLRRTSA